MSHSSAAQQAANRANGALSHGPVSHSGKKRSSINAIRHGLSGRVVVLPNEDLQQFQAFAKEFVDALQPVGIVERQLAQTAAEQQWRLNRVRSVEEGMLALGHFEGAGDFDTDNPDTHATLTAARAFRRHSQAFVNLSIYEQRIHRIQKEALRQLQELQVQRKVLEAARLEEAVKLQKLHQMQGQQYDPRADGFVYSSAEIERECSRRALLAEAELAHQAGYNLAEYRSRSGRPN